LIDAAIIKKRSAGVKCVMTMFFNKEFSFIAQGARIKYLVRRHVVMPSYYMVWY